MSPKKPKTAPLPSTAADLPQSHRRLFEARAALARIERGQPPTKEDLAGAPRLDFWCIADGPLPVLQGVVTGHPHLADGALVATSPLLWIASDFGAARTLSRFYRLGPCLTDATPRQCH